MLELQKIRFTEIRVIKVSVRVLSRDLKILFKLAEVRTTRLRIRQSLMYPFSEISNQIPLKAPMIVFPLI